MRCARVRCAPARALPSSHPRLPRPPARALSSQTPPIVTPPHGSFSRSRFIRHPWLNHLPVTPSVSDQTRIFTFIAANAAAGNLSALAQDWSYLPEEDHAKGTEVLLQTIIYAGIPRVLNAFATVSEVGVSNRLVVDQYPSTKERRALQISRGEAQMQTAYSHKYPALRSKLQSLSKTFDRWVVEFTGGRLLSRPGLDQRERSLCALSATSGTVVWRQFRSLILTALNHGASLEDVRAVLDQTQLVWGRDKQNMVDALWSDLNKRAILRTHSAPTVAPVASRSITPVEPRAPIRDHPALTRLRDEPALDTETRVLALLSAHAAAGNLTAVARDWSFLPLSSHKKGLEALLQTLIFGGFHRAFNALECIQSVGIAAEDESEGEAGATAPEVWQNRGEELLKLIYGKQYDVLRQRLRSYHPDIEAFVIEFAYGRILSRPHLTPKQRELLSVACLSGQVVFPQLHSHLLGALNTGATLPELRGILDQTELVFGVENQSMIDGYWLDFVSQVQKRRKI